MKRGISLWLSSLFAFVSINAWAQTYAEEALIFSRINPGGSARIQAMGGAQVALGGDYSSAFSNPAGLGFFNRSEVTFSLGTNFYNSSSSYLGNTTNDSQSNINVPGFSLVLHSDKNNGKLLSGNFAVSLTRTNNFNQNFTYQGTNNNNSLIDAFVEEANSYGLPPSQLINNDNFYYSPARLGFTNYLFNPINDSIQGGDSTIYHRQGSFHPQQHERVKTTGAQYQFNVSYGVNINDFVYLGATIGLPSFSYTSHNAYSESFANGPLIGFDLTEDYSIKGSGINATIGTIIKPKDFVQFGLSIATPTYYYSVADNYSAVLNSGWDNYSYTDVTNPKNNAVLNGLTDNISQLIANYAITTPWRIKAGATFFIMKHGLITGEVEKINYSKASLSSQTDGLDFSYDNSTIKSSYRNVFNIRLGGEYRFGNYRLRVGYSSMPDPNIALQGGVSNTITSYTTGVGYRTNKYFVDLGIVQTQWNSTYYPYTVYSHGPSPIVALKNANLSAMVTVGLNL